VSPGLRHHEIRRNGTGDHEDAHDLQHMTEVLALPIALGSLTLAVVLEGIGQEDLHEPGAEFASGSRNPMARAAVACGEDFCGDLLAISKKLRTSEKKETYDKGRDVGAQIEGNLAEHI